MGYIHIESTYKHLTILEKIKMTKKQKMYDQINQHGQRLNDLFNTDLDNVSLCKKLFRLENKTHRLAEQYCNGDIDCEIWERETDKVLSKVSQILSTSEENIHINGDPRGYALKFSSNFTNSNLDFMYRDMGGYGIIAPDFREV